MIDMKNSKFLTYTILLFTLLVSSCKTAQTIQQTGIKPIPNSFFIGNDSISAATNSWREYFSDKNLISLIDTALAGNLDALIAVQRIEQAKAAVQYRKGTLLPTVGGGGAAAIRRYGLYTMDGAGNSTTEILPNQIVPANLPDYFVGLQTAWEADVWGKLRNRKKASMARYLASVEGKNWLVTNLVTEVATAYYELLALDHELEIIKETISLQENALSLVTVQKEAAAANELAVKQFQAQLLNSKALELEILQRIVESENRVNMLLGRFPQFISRDKTKFSQAIPSQIRTGIPSDLLRNRPDIKQAELELLASKADVSSAKTAFYPSFHITGGLGFQAFKTGLLFTSAESFVFSLVGGLSAPLINRNTIKAEFKAANAHQIEALFNYQKSILNGYVEVYNELINMNNLQKVYSLKNEEVSILSQSIETSTELFRTGRATYLEVLLTQQNALKAKLDFVEVKKSQLLSTVNIYKALGGGWR